MKNKIIKGDVGMSWKKVMIPDVLFFQEGPGVRNTQFTSSGVKLLNVGNINNGVLDLDATKIYISEKEAFGKYSHFLVEDGDLLIASSGIVVDNFHNKITWAKAEDLPLCMNTSTIRFSSLDSGVLDIRYFSYFLKTRFFSDQLRKLITGSAQLNFGPSHLKQISLPLPPLPIQKRIAEILDAADALRRKDQELLRKYDELAQAIFIDMFGDPVKNEKGWEVKKLKEFGKVQTGNTPPREEKRFYGSFIEWIKTDNILLEKLNPLQATEYLSEEGLKKGRYVDSGSVLVTCIAGSSKSIGNVVLTNRRVSFNQQINSLTPKSSYNKLFIYALFRYSKSIIQDNTTQGMKRIITKSTFENLKFISPPIELQNEFEQKYKVLLKLIDSINFQQKSSENLFDSLLQQAFKGELVK